MPPQGLLLIAAYMPRGWPVRFVDENIAPASAEDFAWADAVFVSGMHIQAPQIHDIARRAKAAGKVTALGGPSVSGVAGDVSGVSTISMSASSATAPTRWSQASTRICAPPPAQIRFETNERLPLPDFPIPAYHLIPLDALSDVARCNSPRAVRIAASSATSRRSTAASRG